VVDAIAGVGSFGNLWLYWVGPLLGSLGAVAVFRMQNPEDGAE